MRRRASSQRCFAWQAAIVLFAAPRAAAFTCSPQGDPVACAALGDLYASADGARWAVSGGWALAAGSVGADMCTFAGVGCSAGGAVTSLCVHLRALRTLARAHARRPLRSLPSSLLSGALPPSLGNLTSLTTLVLHDNYLAGTLPAELARLQGSLQVLDLSGNHFSGALPAALAPLLGSLSALSLANNHFDATSLAPALCGFACNAAAADVAFSCPSAALAAACPACAAAPPRCQPRCSLAVNISSWPASTAAACSGIVHACDSCIPALQAPLRALTADAAVIAACIAQFTPELLAVDISASTLNALGLCAPAVPPAVQSCTVALPNAAASFAAAATTCAAQPSNVCGACYAALAAPFLAAGAKPAALSVCFAAYSAAASAAGVPMLQLSACAANAAGPASPQATAGVHVGAAVGGSLGGAGLFTLVLVLLYVMQRRKHGSEARAKAMLAEGAPAWRALVASEADIELGALLGTGSFASVYEARWQGTVVAVKVFAPNAQLADNSLGSGEPTDASAPDRSFLRDVELLSKLRHPNILAIYAFVTRPRSMLVMELGSLGSLKALLLRCTLDQLPWAARAALGAGVAGGIAFLHSQTPAIIHGDVRSAKVAVDSSLTPKVRDFGMRGVESQVNRGRWQSTTPPDYSNDCFGLGLVLLDLAHINTAHGAPAAAGEVHDAGDGLAVQAHVPPAFAAVVVACTAPAPSARPTAQQAQEMLEDARQMLSGGGSNSDRASLEFAQPHRAAAIS